MSGTDGWVGQQVSTDHTVVPDLSGAPAPALNPIPDVLAFDQPIALTPNPSAPRRRNGGKRLLIAVGALAALGVAGFFALPYLQAGPKPQIVAPAPEPIGDTTQRFVIDGDTMYLEGSVPDENTSRVIEEAAQGALGEERVINNFEITEDAVFDPSQPVQLTVAETVLFSTGRADVENQYEPLIDLAVELMTSRPNTVLTIVGHTDDIGTEDVNLRLSIDRATAVAGRIERRGVEADRLIVNGQGENQPLESNDTPEGRSANRRVEFLITGLLG